MVILLLGSDDYSKKEYITLLAQKAKAGAEFFSDAENLPFADLLNSQDLFTGAKVFVLQGLVKHFNRPETIERFLASDNQIVFAEEKLDRRLNDNKQLAGNKKVEVKQFDLPHGKELNNWLSRRMQVLGGSISPAGAEELAVRLGRDESKQTKIAGKVVDTKEIFSLWQADSEIRKLVAFARGREISQPDVKALVHENLEVDALAIANAIGDNQKNLTFSLLQSFLARGPAADEKEGVIHLNALLAEQFRNVAAVQDFTANRFSEQKILEATGFRPGRLFIIKKIAARFSPKKVLDFLKKLAALDEELKTAATPPKVLLDLIISQLF